MKSMKSLSKGFSLVEIMIAIVLITIATSISFQYYDNYLDEQLNQTAAQQQKQVNKAAQTYIKTNYSTIAAQAMPYTISVATLQAAGFPALPSKNPFGQTYTIKVRNPGSGLMALVVTTGGETIEEKNLTKISKLIGADGGYISSTNTAVAFGAYKAWTETLSNYGVTPGGGHLASALFFDSTSVASDYLYRSAVPGMPSLNAMNTDLTMGGNDITNAGSVTATGALKGAIATITGALTANTVTTNGLSVNGNETVSGTSKVGALAVTGNMSVNGSVTGNMTVNGSFVGGSVKSNQDVIATRYLQLNTVVTEGSACTTTGQVARDSTGALLSCQSGAWSRQSQKLGNLVEVSDSGIVPTDGFLITTGECSYKEKFRVYVDGVEFRSTGDYGHAFTIPIAKGSTYLINNLCNAWWKHTYFMPFS